MANHGPTHADRRPMTTRAAGKPCTPPLVCGTCRVIAHAGAVSQPSGSVVSVVSVIRVSLFGRPRLLAFGHPLTIAKPDEAARALDGGTVELAGHADRQVSRPGPGTMKANLTVFSFTVPSSGRIVRSPMSISPVSCSPSWTKVALPLGEPYLCVEGRHASRRRRCPTAPSGAQCRPTPIGTSR